MFPAWPCPLCMWSTPAASSSCPDNVWSPSSLYVGRHDGSSWRLGTRAPRSGRLSSSSSGRWRRCRSRSASRSSTTTARCGARSRCRSKPTSSSGGWSRWRTRTRLRERQPWKAATNATTRWFGALMAEHYAGDDTNVRTLARRHPRRLRGDNRRRLRGEVGRVPAHAHSTRRSAAATSNARMR